MEDTEVVHFLFILLLCMGPGQNRAAPDTLLKGSMQPSYFRANRPLPTNRMRLSPSGAPHSTAHTGYDQYVSALLSGNPFFKGTDKAVYDLNPVRKYQSRDALFYLIFGLLLILAVIRLVFYKYFSDLFRAFSNPTLSQRQLRDQLSQTPFPALLLNIFFAISLGLYLFLLLRDSNFITDYNIYLLIPSFVALVGAIYFTKYATLRLSGWLFGASDLTDAYIYILYLINKVLGIVLVPFLVILAFCGPALVSIGYYISIIIIVLFIVYRYIRAYGLIKTYISFSRVHFFLYLCAFEIVPVLILGKVVLVWLNGNV